MLLSTAIVAMLLALFAYVAIKASKKLVYFGLDDYEIEKSLREYGSLNLSDRKELEKKFEFDRRMGISAIIFAIEVLTALTVYGVVFKVLN